MGGALVKDRAHFFISWDHQADSRPLYIADIHNAADEKRYNLTTETRDRFLEIARNKYGVSDHPQFGSFDKNRIPMRYLLVWTGRLMLQTCYRLLIICE